MHESRFAIPEQITRNGVGIRGTITMKIIFSIASALMLVGGLALAPGFARASEGAGANPPASASALGSEGSSEVAESDEQSAQPPEMPAAAPSTTAAETSEQGAASDESVGDKTDSDDED
jgi:hypothetical protein